ncbi:hypothetical protein ACFLZ1_03885 [Patescibacteria group bacterium]
MKNLPKNILKDENNKVNKKLILIVGVVIAFALPALSFAIIKIYEARPAQATKDYISPLSENQENTETAKAEEQIYNLDYYLHLAKSFLGKATVLANNTPDQQDVEKVKIINTLNEALKAANLAIKYYPQRPEGYLTRAQVYEKVKHIWPELETRSKQDLLTAKKLMENVETANVPLENEAQPINFIPTQKANLASNITIASPGEDTTPEAQESSLDTNAASGTGILEAGKTEIIVNTQQVTPSSQVYVVPAGDGDNKVLAVKSKKENEWFKVNIDSPSDKDLVFKWWIIN